jgi:hypothetical protein
MGVPCALFWTASACGYMGYRNFRLLIDRGIIPFKGMLWLLPLVLCIPIQSVESDVNSFFVAQTKSS